MFSLLVNRAGGQDSIKAQFSRTTICSLVSWCDQCVNMVNTVGHYQYPCVWCQKAQEGRCTTAYMDDCDGDVVESMTGCPTVGLPRWAFVLTAFSGVIFILAFHALYWLVRCLGRLRKKSNEDCAEEVITPPARRLIPPPAGRLDADDSTILFHGSFTTKTSDSE